MFPMVVTLVRFSSVSVLAATLIACASTPPDAALDDGPVADIDSDHAAPPPHRSAEPRAKVAPEASSDGAPGPREREITARECEVLGQRYGDLVRSDAMADVDPSVSEDRRREFQQKLLTAADKLSDRWEKGCIESLVGKVANEDALECAMHGKTVPEFDACLNGPPAPPPEKR